MSGRPLLIVTNDFPPRRGGIQSMIFELASRLPPSNIAVYCSDYRGSSAFDAQLDFPVHRHPGGLLTPTPRARRRILESAAAWGSTKAWFGAAAPLALLAPTLRRHGVTRIVATTHGHEVGWASLPVARQALRHIADNADVVTHLGRYTRGKLASAVGNHPQLLQLAPGVDTAVFSPAADGEVVRRRYALGDRPVIVCVSRLVPRKGQDSLIEALPAINERLRQTQSQTRGRGPGSRVALLLVGEGPYRRSLQELAAGLGVGQDVIMTGPVQAAELPAHYAAGDVFAMPCRTRRGGMDVEGLGIVYLEASAVGLPVVAGDSGGAPDTVLDGETGFVVPGRDAAALVDRVVILLADRPRAVAMGAAGRDWVLRNWRWDSSAERLGEMLEL